MQWPARENYTSPSISKITSYNTKTSLILMPSSSSHTGTLDQLQVMTFIYRSHAIGLCLIWPTAEQGTYEIKHLCTVPNKRTTGVEEALLSLALTYT